MGGGKLFALSKPGKPGIRPIAVGDCFRRVVGRALLHDINDNLCQWFTTTDPNVVQFSVGLPDGGPKLAKYISSLLDNLPRTAAAADQTTVISLDISNAFNELGRQAILDSVTGIASRTYDGGNVRVGDSIPSPETFQTHSEYFIQYYGGHSELHFRHKDGHTANISSAAGTQQGDVMAMALFAAPLHAVMLRVSARHPDVRFCAFADNVYIVGPLHLCIAASADYATCIREDLGLHCNPADSFLHCPAWANLEVLPPELQQALDALPPQLQGLSFAQDGLMVVGVPVGTEVYKQSRLTIIVNKILESLPKLAACTDGFIHLLLLKFCANTRFHYILRCLPPTDTQRHAITLDTGIMDAFASFQEWPDDHARHDDFSRAAFQMRLPIRKAGWGLTAASSITSSAYWASTAEFIRWLYDSQLLHNTPFTKDNIGVVQSPLLSSFRVAHQLLLDNGADEAPPLPPINGQAAPIADFKLVVPTLVNLIAPTDDETVPVPRQRSVTRFLRARDHVASQQHDLHFPIGSKHQIRLLHQHPLFTDLHADDRESCTKMLIATNADRGKHVSFSPFSFLGTLPLMVHLPFNKGEFRAWAEQSLGLEQSAFNQPSQHQCKCGADLDPHGHHQHTCPKFAGGAWFRAHEPLVHAFHLLAKQGGIPSTCHPTKLPIADNSNRQGDISFSYAIGRRAGIVCDVTMRHPYVGSADQHVPNPTPIRLYKPDTIISAVRSKITHHSQWLRDQNMYFIPLVFDTHGQVDGNVPRLLWWISTLQATRARAEGRLQSHKFLQRFFYQRACAHISGLAARSIAIRLFGSFRWHPPPPSHRDVSAFPPLSDNVDLRPRIF
jgi:hypothetical protein